MMKRLWLALVTLVVTAAFEHQSRAHGQRRHRRRGLMVRPQTKKRQLTSRLPKLSAPELVQAAQLGSQCTVVPVSFFAADFVTRNVVTAVGFGVYDVPFYDSETGQQLGLYADAVVQFEADCIINGAFSFGTPNAEGTFASQINLAFTCNSAANAIIGGSGEYACASGEETFTSLGAAILEVELHICGELC